MGKLFSLISATLFAVGSALAADPAGYEYWFDNDVSSVQTGAISSEQMEFLIDTSELPKGTHYFNCRLNTSEGEFGSIYRKMFFSLGQDTGEISYEYWFDNDYGQKIEGDISAGTSSFDIDVSSLDHGVHYFNCRLGRRSDEFGAVYRKMVFTTGSGNNAAAYEYWIDDNYGAKAEGDVTAGESSFVIDLSGIRKGLHRFNYRLQTGTGEWGAVYSKYFYYSSSSTLPFTSYEYWLDNDYANRVSATATTNPVSFDIDLSGFDKSGGAHYLTLRVRDDDGEWGSFYRKLIIFGKPGSQTPITGYRQYLNGLDLGYKEVPRTTAGTYSIEVDIPVDLGLSVGYYTPAFDGDKVSMGGTFSANYILQIRSELGWSSPQSWDLELANPFTAVAVEMAINSRHTFTTPKVGRFEAVKVVSTGVPLYFRAGIPIAFDLYKEGEKVAEITPSELVEMKSLTLAEGTYYGILRDAEATEEANFEFHLMDTPNMAPTPELNFRNGIVTITCSREDVDIYYTIQDYLSTESAVPDVDSNHYTEPFALDHNAVVKAVAIVPESDIQPSAIGELTVNSYKVDDPVVRFENLMVVITPDSREGVRTYYTLNNSDPAQGADGVQPADGSFEYTTPFSLPGNAKVRVRSFKLGYNPSSIVEYNHNHSTYVTGAPTISVNGTTVTLTPTTSGSTIYYSIDDPNPSTMTLYEVPFTMEGNGTIYAQARKEAMYDSEIVSYEINGRKMPKPQISCNNHMVTIVDGRSDAIIYYTLDESAPTTASNLYEGEFIFDRNGVIKAVAIDPVGNLDNSDIAELVIDDNRVGNPVIRFENLMVVITPDSRQGVRTFYTLSGNSGELTDEMPQANGNVFEYTAPFSLPQSGKVLARSYRDGYHPSGISEYNHNHASYVTAAPVISVEGTTVTITPVTEGSKVWYSIDDPDPETMTEYEAPFTMDGNGTIYAQARKEAMYDSEIVSYEINGRKMPKPQISCNNHIVTIVDGRADAHIYYTLDESAPTTASNLYEGEFMFDRNGVIKAVAIDPVGNLDNSDIAELVIDDNRVENPVIRFENLMVVITPDSRQGVRTFYTLSGNSTVLTDTMPQADGTVFEYIAPFSLPYSSKVLARSYREGYHPSGISEYNHNHASYVTAAPVISVEGTTVTITPVTEGSKVWYSIDDPDPDAMTEYETPFTMDGNGTIYAQARKEAMYDSEVVSYEINGRKMPKPQISCNNHMVTIVDGRADALIYYTLDESAPTPASYLYEGEFMFDQNGVIKAVAIDPVGNLDNSDIAELVIDDNRVGNPVIRFENLMVVITPDSRQGVRTFYTLSGNSGELTDEMPEADGNVFEYTAPFSLPYSSKVLARSYREGYHPSGISEYNHNHDSYVTGAPIITVEGATVTLAATTEGSVIYYGIDNPNTEAMIPYSVPFEVNGNVTVYAQARKNAMYDSEVVNYVVTGLKTDMPYGSFDIESKLLTLECSMSEAVISYAVNNQDEWVRYEEPIPIEKNCTVYAKAEAPNYLESEIAEIKIGEFKCAEVLVDYNGRYLTLSTLEPDAEIRFSLDGTDPAEGEAYADTFDAGGLATLKAVAVKDDFMNSEVTEYSILGYADEDHAETVAEGVLESCFGWAETGYLDSIERIRVEGRLNADDYSLLRSMKALRHLDIEKVTEAVIPRRAFSETGLLTISLPASIESVGDSILRDNPQLCAMFWNDKEMAPDSIALKGITNRNILLYLPNHDRVDGNLGVIRNIIEEGRAELIVLTEGYPFYAPREFDADRIQYVRNFSKHTEIGICSGWETIALPFDVTTISDANGEIIPFAIAGDDDRPFWLYRPVGTGWERTGAICAYEPYIISMPNNPDYIESLNVCGDVLFEASNTRVEATPDPTGYLYKGDVEIWPNFAALPADESMWVVNDDWYEGQFPGSNFVRGLRDVRPFECFATSEISAQRMPIFGNSEVEAILAEMGTKIWCENHDLCILSGRSRKVRIFDTVGQLVRIAEVQAGVVCRVHDLAPGIYLIDRFKHLVK